MFVCKEIHGVKYVAEFRGIRYADQVLKDCTVGKHILIEKLAERLFNEVFVHPEGLSFDYFDKLPNSKEIFDEVITFGKRVLINGDEKKLTRVQTKRKVKDDWPMWRLVMSDLGDFTYDYVFNKMTPQQIAEANEALDMAFKQLNKK